MYCIDQECKLKFLWPNAFRSPDSERFAAGHFFYIMKNKSYYFSHDGNARLDIKIQYLTNDLGMEGYGIYWYLIEALFDAGGYLPLRMAKILAKQMNVTEPKVMAVISNYELFELLDDSTFCSIRLLKHFEQRKLLSDNGKRGASIKWNGGAISGAIGEANAIPLALKKKGKEKKEKEIKSLIDILPENYIESVQMQLFTLQKKKVEKEIILNLWNAFKLEKLESEKYYKESDVYKHFVNWIKTQKFEANGKQNRYEAIVEYADRYDQQSGTNEENKQLH